MAGEKLLEHSKEDFCDGKKTPLWKINSESEISLSLNNVQLEIVGDIFPLVCGRD